MVGVALDELLDGAPIPLFDLVARHVDEVPEHAHHARQLAQRNAQLPHRLGAELRQPPRFGGHDQSQARAAHLRQIRYAQERNTIAGADAP
jgi:hypothetical protein